MVEHANREVVFRPRGDAWPHRFVGEPRADAVQERAVVVVVGGPLSSANECFGELGAIVGNVRRRAVGRRERLEGGRLGVELAQLPLLEGDGEGIGWFVLG